jgi:CoA-transferase family III
MNNRGKRAIALDLRTEPGHAAMLRLLDTADVFVTNLRIPALERLGMDHATLAARWATGLPACHWPAVSVPPCSTEPGRVAVGWCRRPC